MKVKEESPEQSSISHARMSQKKRLLAKAHSDWMLAETKTEPGEYTSAAQDKGRFPSESNLRHEYEQQTREDDMDRLEILDFVESVINLIEHDMIVMNSFITQNQT